MNELASKADGNNGIFVGDGNKIEITSSTKGKLMAKSKDSNEAFGCPQG